MAGLRPKSGPTMHDVAAAAGISQATVSLVLNSASGTRFPTRPASGYATP